MGRFGIQMTIIKHLQNLNKGVVKLMYEECIKLLKQKNISLERGLNIKELNHIEHIYQLKFPKSLKNFLMNVVPVSKGFYNWRDLSSSNINYIKQVIKRPILEIDDMAEEVDWCENWGREPDDPKAVAKEVKKRIKMAPKLIPIYIHRYMPVILDDNPPIISAYGTDIIYYGENLENYFLIEFGGQKQKNINIKNIKQIPFWSELI